MPGMGSSSWAAVHPGSSALAQPRCKRVSAPAREALKGQGARATGAELGAVDHRDDHGCWNESSACSPEFGLGFWVSRVAVLTLGHFTRLGEASTAAGRVGKVVMTLFWQKGGVQ